MPTDPFAEVANRSLVRRSGTAQYARDEFLPALRGQRGARVYQEMADNTGVVGGMLMAIEMVLRQVAWRWEAADDTPQAAEVAEFVEGAWADMSHSPTDLIVDVLTMLPHGWAAFEVVYKRRLGRGADPPSAYDDRRIGWRKLVHIPQPSVTEWRFDETGGLLGLRQDTPEIVPMDKLALFRTKRSSPFGRSILRSAYVPWYRRKRIEEIEAIGAERDLAGIPVVYVPPEVIADATRSAEYRDIAINIRNDEQAGVLLPNVYDEHGNRLFSLELLSAPGSRVFDTTGIINRYNREIAISVLQDVLLLGHERVGTQALAAEKRDLSDTALTAWLDEIESVVNTHVVPRLLTLNGIDPGLAPSWRHAALREDDLSVVAQWLSDLSSSGFELAGDPEVEAWVRRTFGLPAAAEA